MWFRQTSPRLILINPWIYDFAAFDLWSRPLGLLYHAGYLRSCGFTVHLIDCLDTHHPKMTAHGSLKAPKRHPYGTGKYWRQVVPKPAPLKDIPRAYSRYGLSKKTVVEELRSIQDPAAILVTSLMTYWYPGVREVIGLAKRIHPGIPIILGGIYARLCLHHARSTAGADHIVTSRHPSSLLKTLKECNIETPEPISNLPPLPYPAFDLYSKVDSVCLLTAQGCPYRCKYCASHVLNPKRILREPGEVLEEILYWHKDYGIRDFAFYDDALLAPFPTHLGILLEGIVRLGLPIRFHTPNALHVKEISKEVADLLYRAGFRTIRLGLETSDFSLHQDLDKKLTTGDFERAVGNLQKAGFSPNEVGAYILLGLPRQSVDSVMETINFVGRIGAVPYLSEYSPIPHTDLWEEAVRCSTYDIAAEPLFHNNTLLPCWDDTQKQSLSRLKSRVLDIRQGYR